MQAPDQARQSRALEKVQSARQLRIALRGLLLVAAGAVVAQLSGHHWLTGLAVGAALGYFAGWMLVRPRA